MMKVALIGDIHFGPLARSREFCPEGFEIQDHTEGAASITEGLINIFSNESVDYLFVAGDLTSTGSPVEYVECYKAIKKIAQKANIPSEKVIISLGNHDVDWRITDISGTFEVDILAEKSKDLYQKVSSNVANLFLKQNNFFESGPAPFSGVIKEENLTIFVLNSGIHSNRNEKIPHGKIEEDQLKWFKKKASEFKEKVGWKILLLHHHPHSYPSPYRHHDISVLEEGSEIVKIAGENGINIVCHGHRHHPNVENKMQNGWRSPITFICVGSCAVNSKHRGNGDIPNCFHILQLCDDKILNLKSYQYSSKDGWKPFSKNCSETPLDPEMYFFKPFEEHERIEKFSEIIKSKKNEKGVKLPKWDELPIELKSLTYSDLNLLLKELYDKEYDIGGSYPEEVLLLRKN